MSERRLDPARWKQLEPWLDELLDTEPEERRRRLDGIRDTDPELAEDLERLLVRGDTGRDPMHRPLADWAASILVPEAQAGVDSQIGPWRLVERVGTGGMGTVYRAVRTDGAFEQQVALKVLSHPDPSGELGQRMRQESRILAPLRHPNIAHLIDGGVTEKGVPWFAMDLVEGKPITDWCRANRSTLGERLELFDQVCEAVAHAHQRLIVHRDLKPSNILVSVDGVVKLVDFGIAKVLGPDANPGLTRTGIRMMTPRYAAPEQLRGDEITTATDVYGLGAVLYELVGEQAPFADRSSTGREHEDAVLHDSPAPLAATLPLDLRRIIDMALRKEASARYATVGALAEDLRRLRRHEPVHARAATVGYRVRCYLRRHRTSAISATLVFTALLVGLGATIWQAEVARRETQRAESISGYLLDLFSRGNLAAAAGKELTVLDWLEGSREDLSRQLGEDPILQGELLLVLGDLYFHLGAYEQAIELAHESLDLVGENAGTGTPPWMKSSNVLGNFYLERGQLDEAEPYFRRVLEYDGDRRREIQTEIGAAYANLSSVLSRRGDSETALDFQRRAMEIGLRVDPSNRADHITDLNNLGVELGRAGRAAEQDSVLTLALSARRELLGPAHPDVATSLRNLAQAKSDLGQLEEALALYDESIVILRHIDSRFQPDLAAVLTGRGQVLRRMGRREEAAASLEEAIELQRAIGGPMTFDFARTLNSLGILSYSQGDYESAIEYLAEAADGFDETVGSDSPSALTCRNNLGVLLHRSGRWDEARAQMQAVLAQREASGGPRSRGVGYSRKGLGLLALETDDIDTARRHLELAQELLAADCQEEVQVCAEIEMGLGRVSYLDGEIRLATEKLERSYERLQTLLPSEHDLLQRNRRWLEEARNH